MGDWGVNAGTARGTCTLSLPENSNGLVASVVAVVDTRVSVSTMGEAVMAPSGAGGILDANNSLPVCGLCECLTDGMTVELTEGLTVAAVLTVVAPLRVVLVEVVYDDVVYNFRVALVLTSEESVRC